MKKTRYTEEQIAFALKQAETGTRVGDVCRKTGISEATFYIYGLPPFCKHWFWSWVIAYIYPASEKPVSKWVIGTQSPQQLDGLEKSGSDCTGATCHHLSVHCNFSSRVLTSGSLILCIIFKHRPDYSHALVCYRYGRFIKPSRIL